MAISPEKMLTALAGDVADVRRRVEALEEQDLVQGIEGIKITLGDIIEAVEQLQAQQEEEEPSGPGSAPDWTKVNQEEARELWHWLTLWCRDVLRPMYAESIWRPCWYEHPQLRVQLTWLCAYWHWSYEKKTVPPTRAAEWHVRWWPAVKSFMVEEFRDCGYERPDAVMLHPIPPPRPDGTVTLVETDFEDGGLHSYIEAHVARRPPAEKKKPKDS
ncbi:hypothetical protein ACFOSC_27960 [Streptantibioticus rubrisoli]|uniref:DUF4913 domain-containing protein n=1 Tax=Streptantibioticus rubrisoli TaxID=1387313 RepID=A0ABT1PKB8_9ACTN|nr:hypothetical protein [Streptantibioticus rubrisoli]MCQ4045812.1 hypothetical protein [Streptantibioticus rubrisoli]